MFIVRLKHAQMINMEI